MRVSAGGITHLQETDSKALSGPNKPLPVAKNGS